MEDLRIAAADFITEKEGKLKDAYRIGPKLGEGSFGSVRKIIHRVHGDIRAVKTIHKRSLRTPEEQQSVLNEVSVLKSLDHPNIVHLYEFYEDSKNYFLITEYCAGGELFEQIINLGYFSEATAARYIEQILSAVAYCHDRGIVHRDLKPENFLLESNAEDANLKVIDFGTAQHFEKGHAMSQRYGTSYYIAPEVLQKKYNEKCDIWSAGVNLYILLSGYPPFYGNTEEQVLRRVAAGRYSFPSPDWDSISFEAKDLINKMLSFDPSRRLSAKECLSHPWIRNACKKELPLNSAKDMFSKLTAFKTEQKLQKATLTFISSQISTKQEKEAMTEMFRSLDIDQNGTLSRAEILQGYQLLFDDGVQDIEAQVDKIMKEVDTDNSGEIDYNEFVMATMNQNKLLSREKLVMAFDAFDIDHNGTITVDELRQVLGKCHNYDHHIWESIISEIDRNGDGVIDLDEFLLAHSSKYV